MQHNRNSIFINELGLCKGKAIVDIAMINKHFFAYEIKSQSDDLRRLEKQVPIYNNIFHYVSVIVAEKHLKRIQGVIPKWWGIYVISDSNGIDLLVNPQRNNSISLYNIAQLLWNDELISIINNMNIKYRKKYSKDYLCQILAENMTSKEIINIVKQCFSARRDWRAGLIHT